MNQNFFFERKINKFQINYKIKLITYVQKLNYNFFMNQNSSLKEKYISFKLTIK